MNCLTGRPTAKIPLQLPLAQMERSPLDPDEFEFDTEKMWAAALAYHRAGYLTGACIATQFGELQEAQRLGLAIGHGYSVLDCKEVAGGRRLLKLRNPWSHMKGGWKGEFGRGSPVWQERALREATGFEPGPAAPSIPGGGGGSAGVR